MSVAALSRPLMVAVAGHLLLALASLLAWRTYEGFAAGPHPALKPLKFALSIAIFLATMAVLLPSLAVADRTRSVVAWLLVSTMVTETVAITVQAARRTRSHFNVDTGFDGAVWALMVIAIVIASVVMVGLAVVATSRPMTLASGQPLPALMSTAWRAGLWLMALAPVSGFAMGSRMRHSVGGADGGPGLLFLDWSVTHGDLRVAHFFALHSVQVLPLVALVLTLLPLPPWSRWAVLLGSSAVVALVCVGTLVQAFAGRPLVRHATRDARSVSAGSSSGSP